MQRYSFPGNFKTLNLILGATVPVVVSLAFVVFVPGASAQTVADVETRDQLIANQENLLNTYRCLFGVDTGVVPGGCPTPDVIKPGPAPANPTQKDIDVRDGLIQNQEALLNVYRCQFDVDTQLVPGGCVDGKPATTIPVPLEDISIAEAEDCLTAFREAASLTLPFLDAYSSFLDHPSASASERCCCCGSHTL